MAKMNKTTLKDVAKYAGVSTATISNYINKRYDKMSKETQEKVSKAISATGYTINPLGQNLATGRTNTIGLLWPGNLSMVFEDLYFMVFAKAVRDSLRPYNLKLTLLEEDNILSDAKNVDGIIIKASKHTDIITQELSHANIPIVTLGKPGYSLNNPIVRVDDRKTGYIGLKLLSFLGYKDILIIKTPAGFIPSIDDRLQGVLDYTAKTKDLNLSFIECSLTQEEGYNIIGELIENNNIPEAIIALNDETAIGIAEFCQDYNTISIPEDMALIGIGDIPTISNFVGLTTIRHPIFDLGKIAARQIVNLLNNKGESPASANERILPTKLVIRKSCGGRNRFAEIEKEFKNVILD